MTQRILVSVALVGLLIACGGGGNTSTTAPGGGPTAQPPGAATQAPGVATQAPGVATPAPGGGDPSDLESTVRALMPPGATEVSYVEAGGSHQLIATSPMSIQDLGAFYTQQIPALGLTESGRFEMEGSLTIALVNPDGGIVISTAGESGNLITISLGTST